MRCEVKPHLSLNAFFFAGRLQMQVQDEVRTRIEPPAHVVGFGTKHLDLVEGIRARQEHLLITVPEMLEALEGAAIRTSRRSPEYGPLVWLHGVTRRGRGIDFEVQGDRLAMLLVTLNADPAA